MNAYTDGIAALERELTEIDRRRPLIERALVGLRELAGIAAPAGRTTKSAKRGTNERTKQGAGHTGAAEPP